MKKVLLIAAAAFFWVNPVMATEFTLNGIVYETGGSAGGVSSPSGYAVFSAYRVGIAGQTGHQHNNSEDTDAVIPLWGEKIFRPDGTGIPAYYLSDVGSSDWAATPPADGQVVRVVAEIWQSENGYSGNMFVGYAESVINASEVLNRTKKMPDIVIAAVPSPVVTSYGEDYITLSWACVSVVQISGYSLYRKIEPSGSYEKITVTPHNFGGSVEYTDTSGLVGGTDYRYMIKVNFPWGGGAGVPEYFETHGGSLPSGYARLAVPTPTATPSATVSATHSVTETKTTTITATETVTATLTAQITHTNTSAPTLHIQFTPTPTITAVHLATSPGLADALLRERFILISNPLRGRVLSAGIYSEKNGIAELYIYNIQGMLVTKLKINVQEGNNRVVTEMPEDIASGVYVIKGVVRGAGYIRTLPVRKIAVIR